MSKEFKNMDDLFREAFADEQADVPAFVKSTIDKRLGFHKRKTGWMWGITLLGLLLISAGVLWFPGSPEKMQQPVTQNTTETTNLLPAETPSNSIQNSNYEETADHAEINPSATNRSELSGNSSATETDASGSSYPDAVSSFQQTKNRQHVTLPGTSSPGKNEKQTGASEQDIMSEKTTPEISEITGTTTISNPSTGLDKHHEGVFSVSDYTIRTHHSRTPLSLAYRVQELTNEHAALTITQVPVSASDLFMSDSKTNLPDANTIERGEYYSPWMISATAGINFARSEYTFQTSDEQEYYDNSTFMAPGFEGNLDVKYRLKNSLTFGTGAGISQLVENYSFFKESVDIDTTIAWQYQNIYQYDSLLDTTIFIGIDSTLTTTYDSTTTTLYNETGTTKATYLQIPFSMGTQIIRNKFRFDLYVMGRFNYLINGKGGYLQNDVFTGFTNNQNQIFKTWYLDLMIGGAIHYQLLEKLYLTGTFRFHPALGDLYENLSFNRKIQSYHVGVGVSLKL